MSNERPRAKVVDSAIIIPEDTGKIGIMNMRAARIFVSCTAADSEKVQPIVNRLEFGGWHITQSIEDCAILLAFISAAYIADRSAFVSELSYAACALRKPYVLVQSLALDNLPPDLEMLAARDGFASPDGVEYALEKQLSAPLEEPEAVSNERRYAFKPFEACEERYSFVSYAHDDAADVYPVIKGLYEAGWNLWYDEGIRITERYLPEIARHVCDCEVFLLFMTERSVQRPFVIDFELAYAKKLGKKIIPVMMELVRALPEGIEGLTKTAPDETLHRAIGETGIKNFGNRVAVPPKDKKDEEYDLEQLTPMKDYKYKLFGDGLRLEKYTGHEKNVIVPDEHCGLPVRGLARTFYNQKNISSIEIPVSLHYFGQKTFSGSKAKVTFPRPKEKYGLNYDQDLNIGSVAGFITVASTWAIGIFLILYLGGGLSGWGRFWAFAGLWLFSVIMFVIVVRIVGGYRLNKRERMKADLRFPAADTAENATEQLPALALYAKDVKLRDLVDDLRSEGFLISHYTGGETPAPAYALMIAFLTPEFFQEAALVRELRHAIDSSAKILPVYYSLRPDELPESFASSLGQYQGILYSSPEYSYLMKKTMKSNGCWRDIAYDFEYAMRGKKVKITNLISESAIVCVPSSVFDSAHTVSEVHIAGTNVSSCTEIFISETVKEINPLNFGEYSGNLESIHVQKGNQSYYSVDGILYQTEGNKLLLCPMNLPYSRVALPGRTEEIGDCAFEQCKNMSEVVILEGVKKIGKAAFWSCMSLAAVFIPSSVQIMGENVLATGMDARRSYRDASFYDSKSLIHSIPGLTIHTPAGSFAEEYARKYDIPCKTYTQAEWETVIQHKA
ncbi:MAG: TIR domain-containing protein [Eggerthellaceae bacterium]|nr:TIR domain-containing protein [Eggerthellaceae bacterium]